MWSYGASDADAHSQIGNDAVAARRLPMSFATVIPDGIGTNVLLRRVIHDDRVSFTRYAREQTSRPHAAEYRTATGDTRAKGNRMRASATIRRSAPAVLDWTHILTT